MIEWLVATLRENVEIPLFLCLVVGFTVGRVQVKGISLGEVTATLLAALAIGQIGIEISPKMKFVFFSLYLFAVGYSAGPQFVRALFEGGIKQAGFAVAVCVISLLSVYAVARLAGLDVGAAAGFFAGSATTSPSLPLSETAITKSAMTAAAKAHALDIMPAAFSISFIIGTLSSVMILAIVGPRLLKIDLAAACRAYVEKMGGNDSKARRGTAWHQYVARAYRVDAGSALVGLSVADVEHFFDNHRLFLARLRRNGEIMEATTSVTIAAGDIIGLAGSRHVLLSEVSHQLEEVDDAELLGVAVEGTDVLITSGEASQKTLQALADLPETRGVFITAIHRGALSVSIPVLADTTLYRGDVIRIIGRPTDIADFANKFGYLDRETERADIAFISAAIVAGAVIGALSLRIGEVPLTLSTAGGILLIGLFFGWLRSVHPVFGRVPGATLWFMNAIGLNLFIAALGLAAAPALAGGLKELGPVFLLWSLVASIVPSLLAIYLGKYVFRFDDAILFGCCAGARKSSPALAMLTEKAESQVPAIGFSVGYAVSTTLLILFGLAIVLMM